jgi:hypothetical protein
MAPLSPIIIADRDRRPTTFTDRYEEAVVEMLKTKRAGLPTPQPREVHAPNVINLMDALRRSIAEGCSASGPAAKPPCCRCEGAPASKGAEGQSANARRSAQGASVSIPGGKGKAKEEPVVANVPKDKSQRTSA